MRRGAWFSLRHPFFDQGTSYDNLHSTCSNERSFRGSAARSLVLTRNNGHFDHYNFFGMQMLGAFALIALVWNVQSFELKVQAPIFIQRARCSMWQQTKSGRRFVLRGGCSTMMSPSISTDNKVAGSLIGSAQFEWGCKFDSLLV